MKMNVRTMMWGILATVPIAAIAANTGAPLPVPGSGWARWNHTHEELEAIAPKARPEDVATPESIVKALHESVNGPQGPWNSDRFRSLYLPSAVMSDVTNAKGSVVIGNHPIESIITDVEDVHKTSGWYETITQVKQVIKTSKHGGGFAAVYYHGTASKIPGGKPEEDGDSMALLMYDGKRWWVLCDVW
jgi:hypothetical protein